MTLQQKHINDIHSYFKNRHKVSYVILFGSGLKHLRPDSDVDLLLGGSVPFPDRLTYMADLERCLGRKVDIVPVQSTFYDLALQAFAYGRLIVTHNRNHLLRDYFRCRRAYDDNLPLQHIRAERLRRIFIHGQA